MIKKAWIWIFFGGWLLWGVPGGSPPEEVELRIPREAALGEAFGVEVRSEKPLHKVKLIWLGKTVEIPAAEEGGQYTAGTLLGTDVKYVNPGVKALTVEVQARGETMVWNRSIRIRDQDFPAQYLTVPESTVHLSASDLKRVRREQQITGRALDTVTAEQWLILPLQRPVEGKITSIYGLRRFFNREPRSPHRGIDLAGAAGTPVRACGGGRVLLVGTHFFAGKSIYLDHGCGIISVYFHLSEIDQQEGQWVYRGEILGRIGQTGRVTGPHLHFGLYILGQAVNPVSLFNGRQ